MHSRYLHGDFAMLSGAAKSKCRSTSQRLAPNAFERSCPSSVQIATRACACATSSPLSDVVEKRAPVLLEPFGSARRRRLRTAYSAERRGHNNHVRIAAMTRSEDAHMPGHDPPNRNLQWFHGDVRLRRFITLANATIIPSLNCTRIQDLGCSDATRPEQAWPRMTCGESKSDGQIGGTTPC